MFGVCVNHFKPWSVKRPDCLGRAVQPTSFPSIPSRREDPGGKSAAKKGFTTLQWPQFAIKTSDINEVVGALHPDRPGTHYAVSDCHCVGDASHRVSYGEWSWVHSLPVMIVLSFS